jgi:hypothetical protein
MEIDGRFLRVSGFFAEQGPDAACLQPMLLSILLLH